MKCGPDRLWSAHPTQAEVDQNKTTEAGMDDFFAKPVKIAALLTFVKGKW